MASDMLIISYYVWTSVGLVTVAKYMHSNEKCSLVILHKICVMEKKVTKHFVNSIHLIKVQYTE